MFALLCAGYVLVGLMTTFGLSWFADPDDTGTTILLGVVWPLTAFLAAVVAVFLLAVAPFYGTAWAAETLRLRRERRRAK